MQQAVAQKALFQCVDCDREREVEVPPLMTPIAHWPRCYSCGAVLLLMHLILERVV